MIDLPPSNAYWNELQKRIEAIGTILKLNPDVLSEQELRKYFKEMKKIWDPKGN